MTARKQAVPLWSMLTPESVWTTTSEHTDLVEALRALGSGAAILKDYSKSEKHYWHEAMFIPSVADTDGALRVADRFRELRGEAFDTGFVLRRFEPFTGPEGRSWWIDGECVEVSPHPDTPDLHPPTGDLGLVATAVSQMNLRFITVDLARSREHDGLRIVEVGDGQVSDRPRSLDPQALLQHMNAS